MRRGPRAGAALAIAALSLAPARAGAYRPFDGTDADVAERWSIEIELGPVQYLRRGQQNFLEVPNLVLNVGLIDRLELVIDAEDDIAIGKLQPDTSRVSLVGDDVLVKYVLREGSLQEKDGLSLAAEGGVLLPEVPATEAFGASLDVILSHRWSWGAFHWNEWFEFTRERHADLFNGIILEGPHDWTVRPVLEAFYDKDFAADQTFSLLVGAIWNLSDSFSLDAAFRGARAGDEYEREVRLGLTWSFPLGEQDDHPPGDEPAKIARATIPLRRR